MGEYSDKAKGNANEAVGNIKQDVGKATGNRQMEQEGYSQERKGEAQQTEGRSQGHDQGRRRPRLIRLDHMQRGSEPIPGLFRACLAASPFGLKHGQSTLNSG